MLIVDDSILEKAHTDANELTCTHWDHCGQRFVRGLNFATLFYEAPGVALKSSRPVALNETGRQEG